MHVHRQVSLKAKQRMFNRMGVKSRHTTPQEDHRLLQVTAAKISQDAGKPSGSFGEFIDAHTKPNTSKTTKSTHDSHKMWYLTHNHPGEVVRCNSNQENLTTGGNPVRQKEKTLTAIKGQGFKGQDELNEAWRLEDTKELPNATSSPSNYHILSKCYWIKLMWTKAP